MRPDDALKAIEKSGVVAVIRLPDLSAATEIAKALVASGVTILEFTLTSPGAMDAIGKVRAANMGALVGAGSVLDIGGVQSAVAAGAQFIFAPNTSRRVIEACRELDIACVPGALTPTEIVTAHELGATAVKVFPAGQFGPGYLREVLAPLPHIKLIPTGGISAENAGDYLRSGALAVGVGSALVNATQVATQDWLGLRHRASVLMDAVRSVRGASA